MIAVFPHEELYKAVSELPAELFMETPDIWDGLKKVFRQFDTSGGKPQVSTQVFTSAEGAAYEILALSRIHKNGGTIHKVQSEEVIENAVGISLGDRRYDIVCDIAGLGYRRIDCKAWKPETVLKFMEKDLLNHNNVTELYKDIISMAKSKNYDVSWVFDPRSAGRGLEDSVPKMIMDTIRKARYPKKIRKDNTLTKKQKEKLIELGRRLELDLNLDTKTKWDTFVDDMGSGLTDFVQIIG